MVGCALALVGFELRLCLGQCVWWGLSIGCAMVSVFGGFLCMG